MLAEAEKRAAEKGYVAKTESAYASLERKWLRFLAKHGEAYGWAEKEGPTLEQVKHFTTYCYETRDCYESSAGLKGMGDSYELHIRYFLAKFVFVRLAYPGWTGLGEHALEEKCEPFKKEVHECICACARVHVQGDVPMCMCICACAYVHVHMCRCICAC